MDPPEVSRVCGPRWRMRCFGRSVTVLVLASFRKFATCACLPGFWATGRKLACHLWAACPSHRARTCSVQALRLLSTLVWLTSRSCTTRSLRTCPSGLRRSHRHPRHCRAQGWQAKTARPCLRASRSWMCGASSGRSTLRSRPGWPRGARRSFGARCGSFCRSRLRASPRHRAPSGGPPPHPSGTRRCCGRWRRSTRGCRAGAASDRRRAVPRGPSSRPRRHLGPSQGRASVSAAARPSRRRPLPQRPTRC
mmetsp:Transcript_15069/g.52905  ORF Transcript_15069/g.52905 Transcript_15069/m.52905 type:complete len:251 (-) Transcript_15069:377-1129(-)